MKASQSHFSGLENREQRRSWPPRRKGGKRKRRRRERESGDGRNQRGLETSAQCRLSYSRAQVPVPGPLSRPNFGVYHRRFRSSPNLRRAVSMSVRGVSVATTAHATVPEAETRLQTPVPLPATSKVPKLPPATSKFFALAHSR